MCLRAKVIEHTVRAIALGFPDSRISQEREQLALECGAPAGQARAIAAWVKISARRTLERHGIATISREDLIFLKYYIESNSDAAQRKTIIEEFAVEHTIDPRVLESALITFNRSFDLEKLTPPSCKRASHDIPETASVVAKQSPAPASSGAHVNYRFPNKDLFMQRWYDFLAREIPATERPHKVVLTLPTKYPAHEVGQLCKLGFKPENIIGIEGGDGDAIPTFLKESAKLGIDARPGRLEQIVPKLDRRIDVAFLDFLGPPCLGYDEVIQAMPVNDCCFVGVNIMDRREQQEVTSRSESTHVLQNPDFSQHMLETLMERQLVGGRFEEELRNVTKRHHTDFSELKYKIADATMVRQFGLAVPGRTRNFDSLVDSVASIERARALDLLRRSLVKEMPFFCSAVAFALSVGMCQSGLISRQHLGICHNGIRFFNMQMLLAQPLTIKAERYIYKSQVTTRSPNYLSTFAVLRNPFQDLHPCRHLMEALLPLFQAGIIAYRKTGKVDPFQTISVVRRSREGAVLTRPPLSGKDQIDFRFDDAFVSRIRWDQMAKSLQEFQASSANDLHVDSMPDRIELKAAT